MTGVLIVPFRGYNLSIGTTLGAIIQIMYKMATSKVIMVPFRLMSKNDRNYVHLC